MNREETYTLLVADDEPEILAVLREYFASQGYRVLAASNGDEALALAQGAVRPDLLLLDVMMPGMDGLALCRRLRNHLTCPILLLTARVEDADALAGFEAGADDYIPKPFLPQELLLRVYAVLRRSYPAVEPKVQLDYCVIDFDRAEVVREDGSVSLTAKEFALLEILSRNQGKVVTTDAICNALWGGDAFGYENPLNAHIRRVREKIERDHSHPVSLITCKGLGYKLMVCR